MADGKVTVRGQLALVGQTSERAQYHAVRNVKKYDVVSSGENGHGYCAWTERGHWVGYCESREQAYRMCRIMYDQSR